MKQDEIRQRISNCFVITGMALVLLSVVANLYGGRFLCVETVYQVFAASVIIQLAFVLLNHFESKYFLIEITVEMATVLIILVIAGIVFDWYSSIPVWVLILMGVLVYLADSLINVLWMHKEARSINLLISNQKERRLP